MQFDLDNKRFHCYYAVNMEEEIFTDSLMEARDFGGCVYVLVKFEDRED